MNMRDFGLLLVGANIASAIANTMAAIAGGGTEPLLLAALNAAVAVFVWPRR